MKLAIRKLRLSWWSEVGLVVATPAPSRFFWDTKTRPPSRLVRWVAGF